MSARASLVWALTADLRHLASTGEPLPPRWDVIRVLQRYGETSYDEARSVVDGLYVELRQEYPQPPLGAGLPCCPGCGAIGQAVLCSWCATRQEVRP